MNKGLKHYLTNTVLLGCALNSPDLSGLRVETVIGVLSIKCTVNENKVLLSNVLILCSCNKVAFML